MRSTAKNGRQVSCHQWCDYPSHVIISIIACWCNRCMSSLSVPRHQSFEVTRSQGPQVRRHKDNPDYLSYLCCLTQASKRVLQITLRDPHASSAPRLLTQRWK